MPLGREWTRRGDSASHRGRSRPKASARALQAPEAWSHTRKPHGKGTGEKAETRGVSAPRRPLCETGLLHLCGQPQAPGWGACPGRVGVSRCWADLHFAGSTATQDRGPHPQMDGTSLQTWVSPSTKQEGEPLLMELLGGGEAPPHPPSRDSGHRGGSSAEPPDSLRPRSVGGQAGRGSCRPSLWLPLRPQSTWPAMPPCP